MNSDSFPSEPHNSRTFGGSGSLPSMPIPPPVETNHTPEQSSTVPDAQIPGISPEMIRLAGVKKVDALTAHALCGIHQSGWIIPHFDIGGLPVADGEGEFVRLLLDAPNGEQKYHQSAGTTRQIYLTPGIRADGPLKGPFYIVKDEKKALALASEGFSAISLGGFYNLSNDNASLVTALKILLAFLIEPVSFYFTGDCEDVFNFQFSQGAHQFAESAGKHSVFVVCLPSDAPGTGVDDCRAALENAFGLYLQNEIVGKALRINPGQTVPGETALALLETNLGAITNLTGTKKDAAIRSLAKLCGALSGDPLNQNRLHEILSNLSGLKRAELKRLIKAQRKERELAADASPGLDPSRLVDLRQQASVWTRQVLAIAGPLTYLRAGNLYDFRNGKLVPLTSDSLVSLMDSPECCFFHRGDASTPVAISEKEARLVIGAIRRNEDVLRPVDVVSSTAVLAWKHTGPEVIRGYSRDLRILAGEEAIEIRDARGSWAALMSLLHDFDFQTPGDRLRAVAYLISPALASGGFLGSGRAPFFMIEKDQVGTGGGTLAQLAAAIYGLDPSAISPNEARQAKEDVSKSLLRGSNLLYFDNIRGSVLKQLPFLESLLTEPNFLARGLYTHTEVDVTHQVIACTSNGAVLSRDLADRTVRIMLRKRPEGYAFHDWSHGGILEHVKAHQSFYLSCVYSLIWEWATKGRPPGEKLSGFRFSEWEKACAWIVQSGAPGSVLLDPGHKVAQQRLANADFDLLRAVLRIAERDAVQPVSTTGLARIALGLGLWPGKGDGYTLKMGRILSGEFPHEGMYEFAQEFRVVRADKSTPETNYEKVKTYTIAKLS